MGECFVKRSLKRSPVHLYEILRKDVLPTLGLSVSKAARRLGISRQQLHRVLACTHPITTDMAFRIGKFAGNGPGPWLRMQQAYDLWCAEYRMKDELSEIETVALVGSSAQQLHLVGGLNIRWFFLCGQCIGGLLGCGKTVCR